MTLRKRQCKVVFCRQVSFQPWSRYCSYSSSKFVPSNHGRDIVPSSSKIVWTIYTSASIHHTHPVTPVSISVPSPLDDRYSHTRTHPRTRTHTYKHTRAYTQTKNTKTHVSSRTDPDHHVIKSNTHTHANTHVSSRTNPDHHVVKSNTHTHTHTHTHTRKTNTCPHAQTQSITWSSQSQTARARSACLPLGTTALLRRYLCTAAGTTQVRAL